MKYVMLRRGGFRYPVIFADAIEHSQLEGADIVSAGFFYSESGKVETYGVARQSAQASGCCGICNANLGGEDGNLRPYNEFS